MAPLVLAGAPFIDSEMRPRCMIQTDFGGHRVVYPVDGLDAKHTARLNCFDVLHCAR